MVNKDKRLEALKTENTPEESNESIRVTKIELSNYKFFFGSEGNIFDFKNKSTLIYGENGSGKSSLFKAFELLTKNKIEEGYFAKEKNRFTEEYPNVTFFFSNDTSYSLSADSEDINLFSDARFDFLKKLSVFKPMLDYKKLLKVHYSDNPNKNINIYDVVQEILNDFPFFTNDLFNNEDANIILDELKTVLNKILLDDINRFIKYFDNDFKIDRFETKIQTTKNKGAELTVNLNIDFRGFEVPDYHLFLNEAKLTALAISIYFASIKRLINVLEINDFMKILVLDDLLISFDISNRQKLLDILTKEFNDFQIFFFTHDRELFEIYKNKLPEWVKYELYLDDSGSIPKSLIKSSDSYLEKAVEFYGSNTKKDYECSAFFLRKEFERLLKSVLPYKIKVDESGENIKLDALLSNAIKFSSGKYKTLLENLDREKRHILNPLSHDDNRSISSLELKNTIESIKSLQDWKPQINLILPKFTNLKLSFKDKGKITHNYILVLKDNLYLYKKEDRAELSDCECFSIICYEEHMENEQEKFEFNKKYSSLFDIYTNIKKHLKISHNNKYYESFTYNNNGKWVSLINKIDSICKENDLKF